MTGIDWDLHNWCRWHWSGMRWHRGRCGSLESQWRSPQPWYEVAPQVPGDRVDVVRARVVEEVWRGLPLKTKWLLKWHYVLLLARGSILRKLRQGGMAIAASVFHDELDAAKHRLAVALDRYAPLGSHTRNAVVRARLPDEVGRVAL